MAIPTTWWMSLKSVGNCQKLVSWSSIMIERNKHGEYARLSKTASFKKTYLKRFHTVDHQNQRSSSVHNKQIATVACAELESSCPCCSCFYYLQATMHTNMDSSQDFPPGLAPRSPTIPTTPPCLCRNRGRPRRVQYGWLGPYRHSPPPITTHWGRPVVNRLDFFRNMSILWWL